MKIKNKIAIGCLIQWYEIELIEEYLQSVKNAVDIIDNKEKAIEIIKEKPDISSRQLALEIDVSRETARKYLKNYR